MSAQNFIIKFMVTSAIFHYYYDSNRFNKLRYKSYDFIVIGGGSAGSLIAARLSEVSKYKILLLEKGGNSGNYFTEIPFIGGLIGDDDKLVQIYETVKQDHVCGMTDRRCYLYAGKGLGGGSAINGLAWVRGSPLDYDDWEKKYGAKGWSYQDVVPYFKKIEDFLNKTLAKDPLLGTTKGGIKITTPKSYSNSSSALLSAISEARFDIGNYNGINPAQSSITQVTVGNGKRSSSWNMFLKPVIKRDNLDIISFATVSKINFDNNRRAISVSYIIDGIKNEANVSKEVILSAGAIDSPKILMLSGIGDAKELSNIGIKSVFDLPSVGKSFQDQIEVLLNLTFNQKLYDVTYQDYEKYRKSKSGPLTTNPQLVVHFLTDELSSVNNNDTRIEIVMSLDDGLFGPTKFPGQIFVSITLIAPSSRGKITLKSNDYRDDPSIDPNYLSTDEDMSVFKRGIKRFVKFVSKSETLNKLGIKIRSTNIPNCGHITEKKFLNDTFLECLIKMETFTAKHMSSSCRMGSKDDPKSVVDPRLRVIGVKNVRVMDASIMPKVTRGNTNAPTVMIAEKGSEMLIDFYEQKRH